MFARTNLCNKSRILTNLVPQSARTLVNIVPSLPTLGDTLELSVNFGKIRARSAGPLHGTHIEIAREVRAATSSENLAAGLSARGATDADVGLGSLWDRCGVSKRGRSGVAGGMRHPGGARASPQRRPSGARAAPGGRASGATAASGTPATREGERDPSDHAAHEGRGSGARVARKLGGGSGQLGWVCQLIALSLSLSLGCR